MGVAATLPELSEWTLLLRGKAKKLSYLNQRTGNVFDQNERSTLIVRSGFI